MPSTGDLRSIRDKDRPQTTEPSVDDHVPSTFIVANMICIMCTSIVLPGSGKVLSPANFSSSSDPSVSVHFGGIQRQKDFDKLQDVNSGFVVLSGSGKVASPANDNTKDGCQWRNQLEKLA